MHLLSGSLSIAPASLWALFCAGVAFLLALDLSLFHGKLQRLVPQSPLLESALWILVSLGFALWFGSEYGREAGIDFLTAYLVEKSLSIDNLFLILLIFGSFRIPREQQHRVLFIGVLSAVVLRGLLIVAGAELLHRFHWLLYLFGVLLIFAAVKLLRHSDTEDDVKSHWAVRYARRLWKIEETPNPEGRFFVRTNGTMHATTLFLALVVIEATDLIFAVDSIPAVFAVTRDAFIAFASNILAVLGMRTLYFALADLIARVRYLKPGLAVILCFVGLKMLAADILEVPGLVSFAIILIILATTVLSSWYVDRVEKSRKENKDILTQS
jgi:tellurite resistance protein TerC